MKMSAVAARQTSRLPTFDELPRGMHPVDDAAFLRLALIPGEDAALRVAASRLLVLDEASNVAIGDEVGPSLDRFREALTGLSRIQTRTPGGIAWKLGTVLDYFAEREDWEWWRRLLRSAMLDAIELERTRVASETEGGAA